MSTPCVLGPAMSLMRMNKNATTAMPRMMWLHLTDPSSGRATPCIFSTTYTTQATPRITASQHRVNDHALPELEMGP